MQSSFSVFRSWLSSLLVDKAVTCWQDILQRTASMSALSLGCSALWRFSVVDRSGFLGSFYSWMGWFCFGGAFLALILSYLGLLVVMERLPPFPSDDASFPRLSRLRFGCLVFFVFVPSICGSVLLAVFSPFLLP